MDCDPTVYLFLVRHPDVVVNVWELLKISRIQLRQNDDDGFTLTEPGGVTTSFKFLYQSHDVHVVYGEGTYQGPLLAKPVKGRGVLVLKTGYVRETNGRDYITSQLVLDRLLDRRAGPSGVVDQDRFAVVRKNRGQQLYPNPGLSQQFVADDGSQQPRRSRPLNCG